MIRRSLLPALLLVLATPALATELPVRGVMLSSSGLAQIMRGGMVAPDAGAVTFRVPLADVDDILRSLVVADPAGRVEGVRLPAQDLAAEAFRGLPLRPHDFDSRAALFNALRGQEVTVGAIEGRIAEAGEHEGRLRLTLLTATGLRALALDPADEVQLRDAGLAARLARAAAALAETRTADTRTVTVALRAGANAPREIAAVYVAGAPLWKPSWRITVPGFGETGSEARLMGWAVVENHTGADWSGIRLSLVSSEAAAFRQALYTPVLLPRIELPIEGSGQVEVRPDTGDRPQPTPPPARLARAFALPAPAPAAAPVAEAAPAAPPVATEASLGRVAFVLVDPVTIQAGETANVPFLDMRLPAERVWWVQDLAARHPLQALRLRNAADHPLPPGLATIYGSQGAETDGFLGDAQLPGMPAGATRLLAFGRDQGVQLSTARDDRTEPTGVTFRRGAVLVAQRAVHRLRLAVDGGAQRGTLMLDLPARRGETPQFQPVAEGDFGLRVEVTLAGAAAEHGYEWERRSTRIIPLWDPALPEPLPPIWRDLSLDRDTARLPGGTDRLAALREVLQRLPADATGRAGLEGLIAAYAEALRLMDAFRTAARDHAAAEATLLRARRALEDRTGAEREPARVALNAASVAAERSGRAADAAWTAWRAAAQRVVAWEG
ncbi:DUF4139 domain-containing protein [Roseococcus suduntuyensis]|uniref:DUF4139 domain-containing protein n=1 Tax=Roseococcus suduntuyensis TaxID=455361 RepID=A0A840AAD2_9PROT|nr:DUF4139 domain-containing protein [Roseococcus suduntuyensis]MBB3897463.1 hypothetical protein [Roseococcus suduntuyensis]